MGMRTWSVWYMLSVWGIFMSIWGVAQLAVMGYGYSKETVMLVDDVEPAKGDYSTFEDFLIICEKNYKIIAKNCFIAAYMYVWVLVGSVVSMLAARFYSIWSAHRKLERDESYCEDPEWKKFEKKSKEKKAKKEKLGKKIKTHTN